MSIHKTSIAALTALALALLLAGCAVDGNVEQGRVIGYQADTKQVTLIPESLTGEPTLPPVTVRTPDNPDEMGPIPTPGKLTLVDAKGGRLVVYDAATQSLRDIPITGVQQRKVAKAPASPKIDRVQKTITIYSPDDRTTITFAATDDLLALPADTWKLGDKVRYYYKEPGQALRLMNVTKTDLSKSGG